MSKKNYQKYLKYKSKLNLFPDNQTYQYKVEKYLNLINKEGGLPMSSPVNTKTKNSADGIVRSDINDLQKTQEQLGRLKLVKTTLENKYNETITNFYDDSKESLNELKLKYTENLKIRQEADQKFNAFFDDFYNKFNEEIDNERKLFTDKISESKDDSQTNQKEKIILQKNTFE